jgi:hypothetical protein
MDRTSFSRDELLLALRTVSRFLQGFPNIQFGAEPMTPEPEYRNPLAADGTAVLSPGQLPADGSPVVAGNGWGKGIPQPPRKRHMLSPKIKSIERVDWGGVPGRRIAEELGAHGPATAHELMERLHIARPTFNNAISKLRKKKLVASEDLRSGGSVDHR